MLSVRIARMIKRNAKRTCLRHEYGSGDTCFHCGRVSVKRRIRIFKARKEAEEGEGLIMQALRKIAEQREADKHADKPE